MLSRYRHQPWFQKPPKTLLLFHGKSSIAGSQRARRSRWDWASVQLSIIDNLTARLIERFSLYPRFKRYLDISEKCTRAKAIVSLSLKFHLRAIFWHPIGNIQSERMKHEIFINDCQNVSRALTAQIAIVINHFLDFWRNWSFAFFPSFWWNSSWSNDNHIVSHNIQSKSEIFSNFTTSSALQEKKREGRTITTEKSTRKNIFFMRLLLATVRYIIQEMI